jgi:hypothetical protein
MQPRSLRTVGLASLLLASCATVEPAPVHHEAAKTVAWSLSEREHQTSSGLQPPAAMGIVWTQLWVDTPRGFKESADWAPLVERVKAIDHAWAMRIGGLAVDLVGDGERHAYLPVDLREIGGSVAGRCPAENPERALAMTKSSEGRASYERAYTDFEVHARQVLQTYPEALRSVDEGGDTLTHLLSCVMAHAVVNGTLDKAVATAAPAVAPAPVVATAAAPVAAPAPKPADAASSIAAQSASLLDEVAPAPEKPAPAPTKPAPAPVVVAAAKPAAPAPAPAPVAKADAGPRTPAEYQAALVHDVPPYVRAAAATPEPVTGCSYQSLWIVQRAKNGKFGPTKKGSLVDNLGPHVVACEHLAKPGKRFVKELAQARLAWKPALAKNDVITVADDAKWEIHKDAKGKLADRTLLVTLWRHKASLGASCGTKSPLDVCEASGDARALLFNAASQRLTEGAAAEKAHHDGSCRTLGFAAFHLAKAAQGGASAGPNDLRYVLKGHAAMNAGELDQALGQLRDDAKALFARCGGDALGDTDLAFWTGHLNEAAPAGAWFTSDTRVASPAQP